MLLRLSPPRRLPVLQSRDGDDAKPRPRWQWVAFGAAAIVIAWLPLAYASQWLVARLLASRMTVDDPAALDAGDAARLSFLLWLVPTSSLLFAGIAGGYVLGRWGDRAGRVEAAQAAASVALFAVSLSWLRADVRAGSLLSFAVVVPAAALGATLGRRTRRAGSP